MAWGADAMAGADDWIAQRRRREIENKNVEMQQLEQAFRQQQAGRQASQFDAQHGLRLKEFDAEQAASAAEASEKQAASEQRGLYLRSLPPHRRQAAEGQQYGRHLDPHDLEAPEAHQAHVTAEQDAADQRALGLHRGKAQIDAQYRQRPEQAPPGGPSPYAQERNIRNLQSIDELSGKVNRWTTGVGSVLAGIPETDARNFAAELDTLKANIAFGELTAMREASKTGGALGQVSNIELGLLTSALGALDPGQSPANIKAQLQKIKASIERWNTAQSGGGQPPPPGGGAGGGIKILSIEEVP